MNRRFLITDVREPKDNEFIFGCSERIIASTEFNRLLRYFKSHGFNFKTIDGRCLPDDFNGNRPVGYRIEYEKPRE